MDYAVYTKVIGRWRREAIRAVKDKFFWVQLLIVPVPDHLVLST